MGESKTEAEVGWRRHGDKTKSKQKERGQKFWREGVRETSMKTIFSEGAGVPKIYQSVLPF